MDGWHKSDQLDEIIPAFVDLQAALPVVGFDSDNTFHKDAQGRPTRYASLRKIWEKVRPVLQEHGFGVSVHGMPTPPGQNGINLLTLLVHKPSKQYWGGVLTMPLKGDKSGGTSPQAAGSGESHPSVCKE